MVNIHEFICSLPQRYDTILGQNDLSLSVGQAQRICIARSLLKDASVYLFDEITSSLDAESERQIVEVIRNLSLNHTVIVISHKLSTFKYADKILETWYKKAVKSLSDIARLDDEFSKAGKNIDVNKATTMVKPTPNKFNQFPQRT
jgi:ABC-type multidrug transport system fused ATPase/permease subunit